MAKLLSLILLILLLLLLLTPWSRLILEKLTGSHLAKKFPAFYATAFTSIRHLSTPSARSILSMLPSHCLKILSSHLRLGLQSGLFPSGFPTKILYTLLLSPINATCPAYPILLGLITRRTLGEQYRSLSSSLCNLLHPPVTSFLLGPHIFLSTLFSNTLSLRSSLNTRDQVSHPFKTRGKIIVLYSYLLLLLLLLLYHCLLYAG